MTTPSDLRPLAECYPDADLRKLIHYRFAHKIIPQMAHANPRDFFLSPLLREKPSEWAREVIGLWQIAAPRAEGTEHSGIADLQAWNEDMCGWPGYFIQMPLPELYPLAFFVGVVLQVSEDSTSATAQVFTLERTVDQASFDTSAIGLLCRWTASGEHLNHGNPSKADRPSFVAAIADMTSLIPKPASPTLAQEFLAAPLPSDGIRGRHDILATFGISERDYDLHYIRYLAWLLRSGAQSNWNDEIAEHAQKLDALRQAEVALANTNFHQAIVNRIIVRLVTERKEGMPGLFQSPPPPAQSQPQSPGPQKPWWKFW
jgi:hypothetical protein